MFGYAGTILRVNLTSGDIQKIRLKKSLIRKYLGGAGFASRILYDELKKGVIPFSSENKLCFFTGPLTGTLFPQASRYIVAAKSPLTDIWGEAHAAGFWGPELKFAGYDGIIIEGMSSQPVYLWINDSVVKIIPAQSVWGKNTEETHNLLKEEVGDKRARVLCIGQAGENLVRYACIINDYDRAAARSGMGAVMGFKKLKAIVVRGTRDIKIADPKGYVKLIQDLHKKMLDDPFTEGRVKYGTTSLVELMNAIGRIPTHNMWTGYYENADKISGEVITSKYLIKARADFACLQRCGRYTQVTSGPYQYIGGSPEYETQSSLGSRCDNDDIECILYAHYLCNLFGLDGISTGAVISWAMECFEKGILTEQDVGFELAWGGDNIIKLIRMIAFRTAFGDILAEGSWRAAKMLGRDSEKYVMHVKKQEIASQDGRAQKSMGLASATAARGADHLYAFPVLDEIGFDKAIEARYGAKYLPEMGDRLNPKYKGIMVAENENFSVIVESMGVCKYGTIIPPTFFYKDLVTALNLTTDMRLSVQDLKDIGERIVNLNRAFNVREGISRKDDSLPERLIKDPMPTGPSKGQIVELDDMLDEYYQYRGWSVKNGVPTYQKLLKLGLSDVALDFTELGSI
ncbi:MAG: aldehyde ferredoxin oxidoreductase family protein [Candidatus Hodarchaeota archaeon]